MQESIKDIIQHRFLNKETTEQENNEILHWISASEENLADFKKAHQLFHLSNLKQIRAEIDVDKAWDRLKSQLPKESKRAKIIYMDIFRKIAVSILILLAVGFGSLWTTEHFFSKTKSAIVQFEAPKGEKSKIVLADGSQVWLNSQTILKYNALTPRKVSVEGEAYFEVEKDTKHPFEVTTTSGMKIKVTGTKFNLRSYSDEPYVETTLEEGGVIISKDNRELVELKPGQQSKYNIRSNELFVENVSAEIYSLWKNNELRVNDISFAEWIPRIERWYGVSVKLDPKIGSKDRFTMTIKTESLRELLDMMKLTSKFNYEINGEQIEIRAK
ncbi:MAG: DUF4974 domain-containing protein [Bacteroidota bacterium]|nr:DUF4974 domain-containing protein [Bacteroidota bacterium]